jgi:hypothetical protein
MKGFNSLPDRESSSTFSVLVMKENCLAVQYHCAAHT